jgi:hypothetical protein
VQASPIDELVLRLRAEVARLADLPLFAG